MGFNSKNWNSTTLTTSDLNRIEKGIKDSHDTLDLLGEEVSALQLRQISNQSDIKTLLKDTPTLAATLNEIENLLNKDNKVLETIRDINQLVTKQELDARLFGWIKITDIKQDGNSIYDGDSIINIKSKPIDTSLDINSNNAISNKAVTKALNNLNLTGNIPTKLAELSQDSLHQTVTASEKSKWNSILETLDNIILTETDPTVPDWAKQKTKPYYDYAEIINTPDNLSDFNNDLEFTTTTYVDSEITKLQNILLGPDGDAALDTINELASAIESNSDIIETLNQAITNKAQKDHTHTKSEITDFTHTHTKSEITDFGNYLTPTSSIQEAYLSWGGKAIAGSISPLDTAISNRHSANRFAFAKPAGIIIEYSTDGSTYSTYSTTDAQKINLVSGLGQTYNIGARSTGNTVNDKLRVTLIGGTMGVYTVLRKLLLNISTNYATGCNVKIEYSMYTSQDTFNTLGTYTLSGWSGWNSIPIDLTYGGANSWSAYALRLTFGITGINSNQTSNNLQLLDIVGIGDTAWSSPSTMAITGHLYSYDSDQNAVFPASITTNKGAIIKGRVYGNGDDEGLIIEKADNGYAGLCLGSSTGVRSVFYLKSDNSATWRWSNGNSSYDISHPQKAGTIALMEDCLQKAGGTMSGAILFPDNATYSTTTQPTALSYGRLQAYGTLNINGNTDNSGTEYVNITAGHGCSSSTADGLSIGTDTLTWKNQDVIHSGNISSYASGSIISKGSQNPQQNRDQNWGDLYTYNTYSNTNMPTTYTSVIGFGDGTTGTVEIAGCWTSEMGLWYRALRDCNDNWWPWQQIITQRGGTIASGYSLTIEGSIIV